MRGAKEDPGLVAAVERPLAAAQAGDVHALERLLRLVRPFVLRWCRARVGVGAGTIDADRVARDACDAITEAVEDYRPGQRPFLSWVVAITSHTANEACRNRAPSAADAFHELLDRVPELQQAILIMRLVQGLSTDETGRVLGMTTEAVRLFQHRGLARLRMLNSGTAPVPTDLRRLDPRPDRGPWLQPGPGTPGSTPPSGTPCPTT